MAVAVRPRLGVRACVALRALTVGCAPIHVTDMSDTVSVTKSAGVQPRELDEGKGRVNFFQIVGVADQVWCGVWPL
jgi:hypothetical protein